MSQDPLKLERELKFIEESFNAGIITEEEYKSARGRVENQLGSAKKEEEEEINKQAKKKSSKKVKEPPEEAKQSEAEQPEAKKSETEESGKEEKQEEIFHEETDKRDQPSKEEEPKKSKKSEKELTKKAEKAEETEEKEKAEKREKKEITLKKEEDKAIESEKEQKEDKSEEEKSKEETAKVEEGLKPSSTPSPEIPSGKPKKKSKSVYVVFAILLILILFFSFRSGNNPETPITFACEYDLDCQKPGFVGKCLNGSTPYAQCVFDELATPINITIIDSKECALCDIARMKNTLKQLYPGANYNLLDAADTEARVLISRLDIQALPAYIFDKTIQDTRRFNSTASIFTKSTMVKTGGLYLMKPSASGSTYFFNRIPRSNSISLFLTPFTESSQKAFNSLQALSKVQDMDITIGYHTRKELDSHDQEIKELFRQVCIKSNSGPKLTSYLACIFGKGISEKSSFECMRTSNIPNDKIQECMDKEALSLLKQEIKTAEELSINTLPMFIFNNQYKRGGSLSEDILSGIFCQLNRCKNN